MFASIIIGHLVTKTADNSSIVAFSPQMFEELYDAAAQPSVPLHK